MKTEALIQDLAQNLRPVQPLRHPILRTIFWLCFTIPFVTIVSLKIGLRSDVVLTFLKPSFLFQVALLILLSLTTSISAFFLAVPDVRSRHYIFLPTIVFAGWLLIFTGLLFFGMGSQAGTGWKCLRNISILSLPPAGLIYFMLWKAVPLRTNATGVFAFLGASALGCLATRFICPQDDLLHFFVWHCIPVALTAGLGLLIGALFLRKGSSAGL